MPVVDSHKSWRFRNGQIRSDDDNIGIMVCGCAREEDASFTVAVPSHSMSWRTQSRAFTRERMRGRGKIVPYAPARKVRPISSVSWAKIDITAACRRADSCLFGKKVLKTRLEDGDLNSPGAAIRWRFVSLSIKIPACGLRRLSVCERSVALVYLRSWLV